MEINNPFRLNQLNSRLNMKNENNKINKPKMKLVYHNINKIWHDEPFKPNYKLTPINRKKPNLLLNDFNNMNRSTKRKNKEYFDNSINTKNKKKSIFEDNYFMDKFKQKKIKYSFPINKDNTNSNYHFFLNNIYMGFESTKAEIKKPPFLGLNKFKDNELSKITYIEDKNIYNKLNLCFENYVENINDKAIDDFLKHQKRLMFSSTNNSLKIVQKNVHKEQNNDDKDSLIKFIRIEPFRTNINNKNLKNTLSNSYTQDNILKSEQSNQIKLPTLSINPHINSNTNKIMSSMNFNSLEENNTPILTDRYTSENKKSRNYKTKKNIDLISPERKDYKKLNPTSNSIDKNRNRKIKLEFNSKLKTIICEAPPPDYYNSDFFYYIVFPNNCGWLIKKCLEHRLKWKECHSNLTNFFNFKWKDVVTKRDFFDLGVKKSRTQIINHFEFHSCLSNKYNMFYNLSKFCELNNNDVFKYVPFTICFDCLNFDEFATYRDNFKEIFDNINNYIYKNKSINTQAFDRTKIPYRELFPIDIQKYGYKFYCEIPQSHYAGKNLWIVKAPNLNRGRCIKVFDNFNEIIKFLNEMRKGNVNQYENIKEKGCKNEDIKEEIIKEKKEKININTVNNKEKDVKNIIVNNKYESDKGDYQSNIIILQKYIEKPFLYNGRKFDIRIWVLINHKMDIYMFKEGHLKASSVNYRIDNNNSFIHLTNYSLQKYNKNFSKYEIGNEISFETFQNFLDTSEHKNFNFKECIIPKFKEIIELTAKASKTVINKCKKNYCFEIFGYDFMMDEDKNVYLIEINTNPGLEISSKVIEILVPRMIDDALRLTIDDLFKTTYAEDWTDKNGNYKSNYHVDGYNDSENMWEFICSLSKYNEKIICEEYYGFGYPKNKKKKVIKKVKIDK